MTKERIIWISVTVILVATSIYFAYNRYRNNSTTPNPDEDIDQVLPISVIAANQPEPEAKVMSANI